MANTPATCGGCSATWFGLKICHCANCHTTFSTTRSFDHHRRGYRCSGRNMHQDRFGHWTMHDPRNSPYPPSARSQTA